MGTQLRCHLHLAITLLAAACPAPPQEPVCEPGDTGCACTFFDECNDPFASCSSAGICVEPGAGLPPENPGSNGTGEQPPALPANQLLYLTTEASRGNGLIYQLNAYDVDARSSRLVTRLGDADDGPSGLRDPHMALSPDRRWVALTADYFRLSQEELQPTRIPATLWLLSVDGRQFRQVVAPITRNSSLTDFDANYAVPRWSPDGDQIYFRQCSTWRDAYAATQLACLAKVVARTGGAVRTLDIQPATFGCNVIGGAAPSPSGQTILVPMGTCNSDSVEGIYEWTLEPFARKRKIANNVNLAEAPVWLADGSQVVFVGLRFFRDAQGASFNGQAAFVWLEENQQTTLLFQPPSAAVKALDVALAPDLQSVVMTVRDADGTDLRLSLKYGDFEKITTNGRSARPVW